MSWIENARKVSQGFVAPELHALSARFEARHKQELERDRLASEHHLALLNAIDTSRREILLHLELCSANRRIEELQSRQQGTTPQ